MKVLSHDVAEAPLSHGSPASRMPASRIRRTLVAERYDEIQDCLTRYLSRILVESCLKKFLESRGLEAPTTMEHLEEMVGDVMVGLRLFVKSEQLPHVMVELTEILQEDH